MEVIIKVVVKVLLKPLEVANKVRIEIIIKPSRGYNQGPGGYD